MLGEVHGELVSGQDVRRCREGTDGLREETKALVWSPRSMKGQLREGQGGLGQWHLGADRVSQAREEPPGWSRNRRKL